MLASELAEEVSIDPILNEAAIDFVRLWFDKSYFILTGGDESLSDDIGETRDDEMKECIGEAIKGWIGQFEVHFLFLKQMVDLVFIGATDGDFYSIQPKPIPFNGRNVVHADDIRFVNSDKFCGR